MFKTIKIKYSNIFAKKDKIAKLRKKGNCYDVATLSDTVLYHNRYKIDHNGHQVVEIHSSLVKLNVSMTLPKGYGARLKARSSLFNKKGAILANGVGEIEWDYADNYMMNLIHFSSDTNHHIAEGEYIGQIEFYLLDEAAWWKHLLNPFFKFRFKEVDVLTTKRGGFGSSGGYKQ